MKETISFPEEYIPQVVKIIRRGLVASEKDESIIFEVKSQLGLQCDKLESYWNYDSGGYKEDTN